MIYALVLLVVCVGVLAIITAKAQNEQDKLIDRLASLSLQVSQDKAAVAVAAAKLEQQEDMIRMLGEKIEKLNLTIEQTTEDKKLSEVLEKKWEDAIQTISNFDPFGDNNK